MTTQKESDIQLLVNDAKSKSEIQSIVDKGLYIHFNSYAQSEKMEGCRKNPSASVALHKATCPFSILSTEYPVTVTYNEKHVKFPTLDDFLEFHLAKTEKRKKEIAMNMETLVKSKKDTGGRTSKISLNDLTDEKGRLWLLEGYRLKCNTYPDFKWFVESYRNDDTIGVGRRSSFDNEINSALLEVQKKIRDYHGHLAIITN